jgi:hypothetical protein
MLVKITNPRFGGIQLVATADDTGLAEGESFRLVSMNLPFHRAHLHDVAGVHWVTGYADNGREATAPLAEVIALETAGQPLVRGGNPATAAAIPGTPRLRRGFQDPP